MSEQIKRYGKILASVVFGLAIIAVAGWGIAKGFSYSPGVTVPEVIVSIAMADSSDGDALDDAWENGYTEYGLSGSVDNTGQTFTYNKYNSTTGALKKQYRYVVGDSTDSAYFGGGWVTGLRLISKVVYSYDEAGRVWCTRQNSAGLGADNANDKITLTAYDVTGNGWMTIVKGVGEEDIEAKEADDVVTANYYDDIGRVDYVVDAEGYASKYVYTEAGQLEKIYRQISGTATEQPLDYRFASFDTTIMSGRTMMIVSEKAYDDAGRVSKITDARGSYREPSYDSFGHVIKTIAKNSSDTAIHQSRRQYDNLGRTECDIVMATADSTSTESTAVDKVTDYAYFTSTGDHPGLLNTVTAYNNDSTAALTTTYDYDEMGRTIKVIDPDNNESHVVYNTAGRVVRRWTKDNSPITGQDDVYTLTEYVYAQTGQVSDQIQLKVDTAVAGDLDDGDYPDSGSTYPLPATDIVTLFAYNDHGQMQKMTDPEGKVTAYTYNWLGQKATVIANADDGDGATTDLKQTTEYGYDRLGRQITITGYTDESDSNTEQTTTYAYTDLGQVESITYPDNTETIDYTYNTLGQVAQRTDQRDIVTGYTYDTVGNLRKKVVTVDYDFDGMKDDRVEETFTYDSVNRMLTAKKEMDDNYDSENEDFVHISTSTLDDYTSLGAAESIQDKYFTDTVGKTSTYDHDQAGNLTQMVYPAGSTTINRTNDARGRIDTLKLGTTQIASYEYIGGRVGSRTYDDTDSSGSEDVVYSIEYDDYGRASRHYTYENTSAPTVITDFGYTFDDNSNITDISFDHRDSSPSNDYTYDGLNRLEDVEYLDNVNDTESFTMDDLGNRDGNQTLRSGTVSYTVNDDTNRYTVIGGNNVSHDSAGNMTTDHRGYDYYYDYENRIMLIEDAESTTIASFEYDALGRRIRKTDYTAPGDPADQQTLYHYNAAWQVLTEHDGTGYFQRLFVYGNYIDETLMMDDGTDDHYYAHNHLFSTVALLEADGSIAERYEYDAYGKVTVLTDDGGDGDWFDGDETIADNSAVGNPYTFTGRRLDSLDGGDLSIMYYRHRYYDPEIGRFLTCDPLGIDPAGLMINPFNIQGQYADGNNLYQYSSGLVTTLSDPMGLYPYNCGGTGFPGGRNCGLPRIQPKPSPPEGDPMSCPCGYTRRARTDGYVPIGNGCGPEGAGIDLVPDEVHFGPIGFHPGAIPHIPFIGEKKIVFRGACNVHDKCYGTYGRDKDVCDKKMLNLMKNRCLMGLSRPFVPDILNKKLQLCYAVAEAYYAAVQKFGDDPFIAAQQTASECYNPTTGDVIRPAN